MNTFEIVTEGLAILEAEIAAFVARPPAERRFADWGWLRSRVHKFKKSIRDLPPVSPPVVMKREFPTPRQLVDQVDSLRVNLQRIGLNIL